MTYNTIDIAQNRYILFRPQKRSGRKPQNNLLTRKAKIIYFRRKSDATENHKGKPCCTPPAKRSFACRDLRDNAPKQGLGQSPKVLKSLDLKIPQNLITPLRPYLRECRLCPILWRNPRVRPWLGNRRELRNKSCRRTLRRYPKPCCPARRKVRCDR